PVVDGADPVTGGGRYAGGYWQGHEPGGFDGSGVLVGAGAAASAEVRPGRVRTVFRETVETILLALLIFISVRSVIQNFKVEGSSMEPNLHSGQYLLVNKAAYWGLDLSPLASLISAQASSDPPVVYPFGAPNRGDVIVFRYPKDPRRDFIKRVIAVAGDKVEVQGSRVLVNGQMLSEPYIVDNPAYSKEATIVPPDHYYVLGDNRNNSSDSHVWGPVPREMIIGKAWLSYWPMSDWGLAPNYAVQAGQ
ncbi:MAG: signal peptidase I, partial [Chloroflexi bacterium]|nr:signal peptidase I [Chloroflexota bacterium]